MQSLPVESKVVRAPGWLWVVSILGMLWNVYGVYQFAGTFTQAGQAGMTAGMTTSQAQLYLSLPPWIDAVFALGVFGGLVGSICLALQRLVARRIFAASFVGYALLFAGDTYYGVFAAIPGQLMVLACVVLIAAALVWASSQAAKRGLLR